MGIPYNANPIRPGSGNGVSGNGRLSQDDLLDGGGYPDGDGHILINESQTAVTVAHARGNGHDNEKDICDLLVQRGATHGNWKFQCVSAQKIKATFRECGHWDALHPAQKEALESIATKISRILNGNPNEPDHWNDIAGYAKLGIL